MKWLVVPALLLCSSLHAAPWWQPLGPLSKDDFSGGHADKPLNDAEKKAATATKFQEWATYEDDFVRFKYPKDPAIRLRVLKEGQPAKVEGGVCTSVDNSFRHAYLLEVGASTYGLFLLNPAEWLDDGICLCGPMIHHAYSMREGCLVRYSLLPRRAVKKAQWLGGGLRLMAFEWTHLACPREVYQEMIDSMVLKLPANRSETEFRAETIRRYGLEGKAGWLHPGQSEKEIVALLGSPQNRMGNKLKWIEEANDYRWQIEADLTKKHTLLKTTGVKLASEVPVEGTLSWVRYWFERDSDVDPFEEIDSDIRLLAVKTPKPTPEKLAQTLLSLSPKCSSGRERRNWAGAVEALATKGKHREPLLLEELLRQSSGSRSELEALTAYAYPKTGEWVKEKLIQLPERPSGEASWELISDAGALLQFAFEYLPAEGAKAADALIAANKRYWIDTLLGTADHLSPVQRRQLVVQATAFALAEADAGLAERIFTLSKDESFDDPAAVKAAIHKFPPGQPDSDWSKARQAALDHLNKTP